MSDQPKNVVFLLTEDEHCCGVKVLAVCDSVEKAKQIATEKEPDLKGPWPWEECEFGWAINNSMVRSESFIIEYFPEYNIEKFEVQVEAPPS